jgi:dihydropteroate synthase
LFQEGADIIDIGGESTRPGSEPVAEEEEYARVIPVIRALKREIPIPISIDTVKPNIAKAALDEGAAMLNDVSGFCNPDMIKIAKEADAPICVMHMRGTPKTMQINPCYEEGIIAHLLRWFEDKTLQLLKAGVKKKNIILDPGIGFGKTVDDNLKILHNLQKFKASGFPVLVGLSRKSFMSKIINKPAKDTLATTIALNTVALLENADIIRVHDVAEHRDVVDVLKKYFEINKSDEMSNNEAVSVIGSRP